ncbi:MAG TPA: hypothetical protein VMA13_06700 [Candidatus Saccharimonadales bacterium]|nr:hypothetical protein [Candidatus Saccharimonadales bacterium]
MNTLSLDPKIIGMARALKLDGDDAVQNILAFCRRRVAKMLKSAASIQTIWDFEKIVCTHLNLVIHEIWNDDELNQFSTRYAADEGDPKFAALAMELEAEDTFGVLYQRNRLNEAGEFQYVAFVDCRGDKKHKRFFTRWHEIAHCLTSYEQFEFPFKRTNAADISKDPVEKLMDMIAGDLGFLEPLFRPVLHGELGNNRLTFNTVESVRNRFCPDASFQATLNACITNANRPTVLLEVGLGLKQSQKRALQDGQLHLLPSKPPKPCLRVLRSMSNNPARNTGLLIHKNWRVPGYSIIAKVFNSDAEIVGESVENLGSWKSSDGSSLKYVNVLIQAKKVQNRVFAIISLAE